MTDTDEYASDDPTEYYDRPLAPAALRDEAGHTYTPPHNSYHRNGHDWPYGDEDDVPERVTDRLGVLPDGVLLRLNPPEQPSVDDVLTAGSLVHASYHAEGRVRKVFRVRERRYYGVPAYTVALGDPGDEARADGLPKNYQGANIKELVYQDGAIRKLFHRNDTVLEVRGYEAITEDYQATLAAGWSA